MISDAELPGVKERYGQATTIEAELCNAGFEAIGLDHFAQSRDSLAMAAKSGTMWRSGWRR